MKKKYSKQNLLKLINYLTYNTDNYAIGAHLYGSLDVNGVIDKFESKTGKKPAFVDFDMNSLPFVESKGQISKAVSELTMFDAEGGFVTLTDHWLSPTVALENATLAGANNSRYTLTKEQYLDVTKFGTELNKNFMSELKIKAEFLKMLDVNGVNVIFRPMHEANGGWFWWGINEQNGITGTDVANLYKYVYNYFTVTCNLKNILWEFNPSINGGQNVICDWFPKGNYIDILSVDWYLPHLNYQSYYDMLTNNFGKLPFAVSEFGGDGDYNASSYPLTETLSKIENYLNKGAKVGYVGLYFDFGENQDCSLSSHAVTLDKMPKYWENIK